MSERSVIVVVLDRWGAGQVSALGATMLEMPAVNRLAASALSANFCISDSPDLERVYRSYATARHAADVRSEEMESWLHDFTGSSLLVTDEPLVSEHLFAREFEEKLVVPASQTTRPADETSETHLARLLFAAGEAILRQEAPGVAWVHARAMEGPWDAPQSLRRSLSDEEDPDVPELVTPPSKTFGEEKDFDEILGVTQAYGGQVLALDEILGSFIEVLDERPAEVVENTLIVVTSPRGFPLGEHGVIGGAETRLHSELLQVPLFLRFGRGQYGQAGALTRTNALVQPADIAATIADWLGIALPKGAWGKSLIPLATRPDPAALPPELWRCALGEDEIRGETQSYFVTPAWALRRLDEREELFAKPDDRWEQNEIGSRAQQARQAMGEMLAVMRQAISEGSREKSENVPELLVRTDR